MNTKKINVYSKNPSNMMWREDEIDFKLLKTFDKTPFKSDLKFIHNNIISILKIKKQEYQKLINFPTDLNIFFDSFNGEDYEIFLGSGYYAFKHILFADDIFIKMDEIPELKRRVRELKISKIKSDC